MSSLIGVRSLGDLAGLLSAQQAARYDVVTPAAALRAEAGTLLLDGAGPVTLSPDGVTTEPGRFRPTGVCDTAIAENVGIPTAYLRRLRAEQLGLYDANVNTWLAQDPARPFLLRTLRGQDPAEPGIARALLSDQYKILDNLDVLLSVLDGIRAAGTPVTVDSADLTERGMDVQVRADAVAAHAPTLLAGYTSPFSGARGADNPTVFAGFLIVNSEAGHGSFSIIPRLVVEVCRNGLTITKDILRKVHLGARMEEGIIRRPHG